MVSIESFIDEFNAGKIQIEISKILTSGTEFPLDTFVVTISLEEQAYANTVSFTLDFHLRTGDDKYDRKKEEEMDATRLELEELMIGRRVQLHVYDEKRHALIGISPLCKYLTTSFFCGSEKGVISLSMKIVDDV